MVDFGVRQLLLAALGATGSLLIDLTALAQLSSDTSTFSGVIAAMCVFDGLGNSYWIGCHMIHLIRTTLR